MPDEVIGKALRDLAPKIYDDLARPATQVVGAAGADVAALMRRSVNAALLPVKGLVWSFEQVGEYLDQRVAAILSERNVGSEKIVTPPPNVAAPAIQGLLFAGPQPELREMFASLLATAMDGDSSHKAHPAFAEILRQLTPDEARLLRQIHKFDGISLPVIDVIARPQDSTGFKEIALNFSLLPYEAKCEHPDLCPEYIDNLCRLGLVNIPPMRTYTREAGYEAIMKHEYVRAWQEDAPEMNWTLQFGRKVLSKTQFGLQFFAACL